jgi:ubiquinone/menaquinone biosynthesis C-methylase UbiE
LQYKDNAFDLVLCNEVLEHVENPEKALQELKRVTSKYLLLSVPNEPIFMASNFLRGKNVSRWGNDIEHINHWSRNSFKNFVKKELQIHAIYNPFPWTIILAEKV